MSVKNKASAQCISISSKMYIILWLVALMVQHVAASGVVVIITLHVNGLAVDDDDVGDVHASLS